MKPAIASEARALAAEDVTSLTTPELASHVGRALDFCGRTVYWHHRFNCCTMIPTGDFLGHAADWTGLAPDEILQALRGSSPISVGAVDELAALRTAILRDAGALSLVVSGDDAASILTRLRQHAGSVWTTAAAYLDVVGPRIIGGYDLADRMAQEHPELLVKIIRTAISQDEAAREASAEQAVARVRDRVPAGRRDQFDDLLREAQVTYAIRDERNFYADALGLGIARRSLLEAGARLARQGRLEDPAHLVDATSVEIAALLEGGSGPSAAEIAERVRFRTETPQDAAPVHLGFPPSGPPPADWLPAPAARLQRAVGIVLALMFAAHEEQAPGKVLKGFAASAGVREGTARVIRTIGELPSVQGGEVLVTQSTAPTFNVVLPLVSAIVTERGGALSHAAIVAREYGVPAVVGCGGATRIIRS